MPPVRLVLASSSPFRRDLLARLGLPFDVVAPDVDESRWAGEAPAAMVKRLAIAKAQAVATRETDGLVIGSDQVVVYGNLIASKPGTHDEAVKQLRAASGQR